MAQILLVDDEKLARTVGSDYLTGAGHTVTAVESSAKARELLSAPAQPFDLLLTDLLLPESDGLELLTWSKERLPDLPVVVITALEKVEPAVRAIRAGAADYLVKPVTPETLAHTVNRALAQQGLLKENEELRRHIVLMEAGTRLASTLDREKLLDSAASAFCTFGRATSTLVFARGTEGLELAATHEVPADLADELKATAVPWVLDRAAEIGQRGCDAEIDGLPPAWETGFLVPAWEGERLLGVVLLLFADAIPDEGVSAAGFLARQFAQGLKNVSQLAAVEDLVYLDDLTHLFNSRYLDLVLDREFKALTPASKPFALLFLDLDYFKTVNDAHGHVVGSKLLVEVSRVLKNCVRDHDVVSRWGGDEYVILLRATDSGGALKVAERIRRAIENHRFLAREGHGLHVTTCIGIASYPEHATDKQTLLDFADRAMYRGKKSSRNIIYMASKGLEATPAARSVRTNGDAPGPKPEGAQDKTQS